MNGTQNAGRELRLELTDTQWPMEYTDHDRVIARAIVTDREGQLYFVRVNRDDDFGKATLIETSGGGVEPGETPAAAVLRELREELGAEAEVICRIGLVSDYYNLIHRHNLNHYFLCRVISFGDRHLTRDEREQFHLSPLKLSYEEAVAEYERCGGTRLGRLIANRELPVLRRAKALLDSVREDPEAPEPPEADPGAGTPLAHPIALPRHRPLGEHHAAAGGRGL